jgi:basic membrane lipoprotein Med (substrate-binding protein (PBP1-ABC) superfamily)
MNKTILRISIALTFGLIAAGGAPAQTPTQNINVTVVPAMTVEERVANDMKEKALRKAAEEKLAAEESARIAESNPKTLLSRARTFFIDSDTSFFDSVQMQNALRKRAEANTWNLAIVDGWDKRSVADVLISIDRPLFTYTFTYKVTHRATGILLATGKVTAIDGNAAAPKLAEKIVEEIRTARGEVKPKNH